ncbi:MULTISPECIES: ABC transporter permease [Kocuria]|uniref:PH-like domain-containing protein n=1 Tax=Kocuria TaxID=57493 RepID=UPI00167A50F9|nr:MULTISPECIES: ABC transporter permease [Kocuria]
MDEKLLTAVLLAVFVIVLFSLVGRAWLRRTRQAEESGSLPVLPADIEDREPTAVIPGMYVATCRHRDHLQRLMAHNLGLRTSATVFIYPDGVLYDRDGADALWVDAAAVVDHGTTSGMVGKFVERDGIVVVSWRFHDQVVDTGMRTKTREGKTEFLEALSTLVADQTQSASAESTPAPSTKETP